MSAEHQPISRRTLLRAGAVAGAGAALAGPAAAWARQARRAAAIAPAGSDLEAVEHVVVLMMENRSYDHYFGAYPRGRGFNDHPAGSYGTFAQPDPAATGLKPPDVVLPFPLDGLGCTEDQTHAWPATHGAWNDGAMNAFVPNIAQRTMGYYNRSDIPFHWALADNFTLCDGYHCSVLGPTHPNRLMMVAGTIDPAGQHGGPVTATNVDPDWKWTLTMPTIQETLEDAGVSWKIYSPSDIGAPARYAPLAALPGWNPVLYNPTLETAALSISDQVLQYFASFESPASSLYQKAFLPTFPADLYNDVRNDTLPAVSWIVPALGFDEHPDANPVNGEWFMSAVLSTLTMNRAVWAKTALLITYDEHGGWFDHVNPPTAPAGTPGEYITAPNPSPNAARNQCQPATDPVGLGLRVPMMVVSPFSRGGRIDPGIYDHTSMIQLIENRFSVKLDSISAWRRAAVGDLSSTLSTKLDTSVPALPATSIYMPLSGLCSEVDQTTDTGGGVPTPPTSQAMPRQGGANNAAPAGGTSRLAASSTTQTPVSTKPGVSVKLLDGGHHELINLQLHATGDPLHDVVIQVHAGNRLVATKQLKTLGTRARKITMHHRGVLHRGHYNIKVSASGKRLFDHNYLLGLDRL